jgi:hypothetical protein
LPGKLWIIEKTRRRVCRPGNRLQTGHVSGDRRTGPNGPGCARV